MFIVVGLGNPGKQYEDTRHNVGFNAIEVLAERNQIDLNRMKFNSVYGEGFIGREKVILVKPQTYMNNSGIAVKEISEFYKLPIENIIVIVDDIDIDFATIRIKGKGSAGSHNGLKSIINHMKDKNFPRVKIGIGQKKHPNQDLADFVLGKFDKDEKFDIDEAILKSTEAVEEIILSNVNTAMNKYT